MPKLRLGGSGRGLAHILGGSLGAQLVALAALPFLSRIYTPAEYGYFTLVLALAALVTPVATLRFETAAMLPEGVEQVRALVWNALISTVVIATTYGLVLYAISLFGADSSEWRPSLPIWVALSVLLAAVFVVFSQLSLRNRQYALVARRTLMKSVASSLVQLAAGVGGRTADGLIIGSTVGNAVGISSMYARNRDYLVFPGGAALRAAWREYWRFPAIFAPSAFLNSAGLQAPLIFFTIWFGVTAGGQLGMAERVVGLPLILVGAAVGQVIDAEISRRIRERRGNLLRSYLQISGLLAALALIVVLALGLLGGWVIPWALGEQWTVAGQMVQILALTAGIRLVASPLSKFMILLQASLANLIVDVVRVVTMAVTIAFVVALGIDLLQGLWIVYSGLSATYAITWIYGLFLVRSRETPTAT